MRVFLCLNRVNFHCVCAVPVLNLLSWFLFVWRLLTSQLPPLTARGFGGLLILAKAPPAQRSKKSGSVAVFAKALPSGRMGDKLARATGYVGTVSGFTGISPACRPVPPQGSRCALPCTPGFRLHSSRAMAAHARTVNTLARSYQPQGLTHNAWIADRSAEGTRIRTATPWACTAVVDMDTMCLTQRPILS